MLFPLVLLLGLVSLACSDETASEDQLVCDGGAGACDQGLTDSDGDGLPDAWELNGLDVDGDGRVDLDLQAMGASHLRRDAFVELDWMEEPGVGGHSDRFSELALDRVRQAFLDAPLDNPDGSWGISLHIDSGPDSVMDPITGATWGRLSEAGVVTHQLDLTLGLHAQLRSSFQVPARRGVFRYAVAAHSVEPLPMDFCEGEGFHLNGLAAADQIIVSLAVQTGVLVELGGFMPGARDVGQQASLFMHELGHTFGLQHGGSDGINRKPNYLSVMNYSFTYRGLLRGGQYGHLDYSRFGAPVLDEPNLSELSGLRELDPSGEMGALHYCGEVGLICEKDVPGLAERVVEHPDLSGPIDWNCDDSIDTQAVAAEINLEGPQVRLSPQDDWRALDFTAHGTIGPARTPVQPAAAPAPNDCLADPAPQVSLAALPVDYRVRVYAPAAADQQPGRARFLVANLGRQPDRYGLQWLAGQSPIEGPAEMALGPGESRVVEADLGEQCRHGSGAQAIEVLLTVSSRAQPSMEALADSLLPLPESGRTLPTSLTECP